MVNYQSTSERPHKYGLQYSGSSSQCLVYGSCFFGLHRPLISPLLRGIIDNLAPDRIIVRWEGMTWDSITVYHDYSITTRASPPITGLGTMDLLFPSSLG